LNQDKIIAFLLVYHDVMCIDNDDFIKTVTRDITNIHAPEFGRKFLTHPETFSIDGPGGGYEVRINNSGKGAFLALFHPTDNIRFTGILRRLLLWRLHLRGRQRRGKGRGDRAEDMVVYVAGKVIDLNYDLIQALALSKEAYR
jgi:hypothetical protein